eukprot:2782833-Prymnesium_polylepis.1
MKQIRAEAPLARDTQDSRGEQHQRRPGTDREKADDDLCPVLRKCGPRPERRMARCIRLRIAAWHVQLLARPALTWVARHRVRPVDGGADVAVGLGHCRASREHRKLFICAASTLVRRVVQEAKGDGEQGRADEVEWDVAHGAVPEVRRVASPQIAPREGGRRAPGQWPGQVRNAIAAKVEQQSAFDSTSLCDAKCGECSLQQLAHRKETQPPQRPVRPIAPTIVYEPDRGP